MGYEKFWDSVRVEYAIKYDSLKEGREQGFQQGLQQGIKQGLQQGLQQGMNQGVEKGIEQGREAKALEIARNLKLLHIPTADIAKATGLTARDIEKL